MTDNSIGRIWFSFARSFYDKFVKAHAAGVVFNEYKWHPSEIAMVVESQRTRGGCWDGICLAAILAQPTNINAFFKESWPKDIVKELKSKR